MERTLFSEEHQLFRSSFRRFVEREIKPQQERWNEAGVVDREAWRKAGEGGFLCRSQVQDHSGKERTIFKVLREAPTADAAREWLVAEIRRIKAAPAQEATKGPPAFADYALSLAERKVREGTIKSAHSREVLASILEHHLIPFFGEMPVDKIRRADVIRWKDGVASRIQAGEVSPHTANGWWSVLRATINAAVAEHELDRNPVAKVEPFDTSEHPAHTREDPNSLTPEEFGAFVTKLRELFPQHHAMALLGFVTGLRPSSLRPLRRHGEHAEIGERRAGLGDELTAAAWQPRDGDHKAVRRPLFGRVRLANR